MNTDKKNPVNEDIKKNITPWRQNMVARPYWRLHKNDLFFLLVGNKKVSFHKLSVFHICTTLCTELIKHNI